jgi:hypothetical protein
MYGSLAQENHPMAKFMWGNLQSLSPSGTCTSVGTGYVFDIISLTVWKGYACKNSADL